MKQTITVLLIEDDPDYAALVKAWLAQNVEVNFDVNWTNTLSAGIYRLAEGGIDVALLDLSLPDSEGPQTFRALQKRARTVPVILLSGNDRESLAFDLIGSGAQDYLVKSRCSPEVLSRSILYSLLRHPRGEKQADEDSSAKVVDVLSTRSSVAPALRRGIERTRRCPCMNWLFYVPAGSPAARNGEGIWKKSPRIITEGGMPNI